MLRGRKVRGEVYVRRLKLEDVPDDDEGASNYLHELYRDKVRYRYCHWFIRWWMCYQHPCLTSQTLLNELSLPINTMSVKAINMNVLKTPISSCSLPPNFFESIEICFIFNLWFLISVFFLLIYNTVSIFFLLPHIYISIFNT